MIEPKEKPCRGTGKALGHGCGEKTKVRKYGLCMSCYPNWLYNTDEGQEVVKKHTIRSKKKSEADQQREWNEEKKRKRPYTHYKENKKNLQLAAQKLARMIDVRFGYNTCIDCALPFTQDRDRDGGHFHSKGSNTSIALNLHNIHSQKSNCNSNGLGGGKQREYLVGLENRYGKEYAEYVDTTMVRQYPYIGLKEQDVADKLKTARKLIRDFDTFQFEDAIQARDQMNQILGIYTFNRKHK